MKNIIFKVSALVIIVISSCSPKFGRIITNSSKFSSNSISNSPNIADTVKQNNKPEGIALNLFADIPGTMKSAPPIKESINKLALAGKNSSFIYRSEYRPEIMQPKAAKPIFTATVPVLENKPCHQDNQLTYITLGLLSLGFLALHLKNRKNRLSENSF